MLATAMAADSGHGGGAADPFAGLNIEFKEVRHWQRPDAVEAVQHLRPAVGVCCSLPQAGMSATSAAWQLKARVIALCHTHASAPVQVNQKTLTYVDPSRLAANQGKRQALGMQSLTWLPLCAVPVKINQLCTVSQSHVWAVHSLTVRSSRCCCVLMGCAFSNGAIVQMLLCFDGLCLH
jgi:hypothetical protein